MNDPTQDSTAPDDGLAQFRAAVLADAELQEKLQDIDDADMFVDAALSLASARGFSIKPDELRRALRGDPLGISPLLDGPLTLYRPQQQWLPIHIAGGANGPYVDWAHFGPDGPTEPFFEDSVRVVLRRPINRLARHRTALGDLAGAARSSQSLRPSGLIFHMSRCGSTLVSQMLARDRRNIVISEAPPLDAIVRDGTMADQKHTDQHAVLLASMLHALGRKRAPWQDRYFIKLDSWHILDLPLFRKAFPDVRWIFLYREPAEVLASQVVQRGMQTVSDRLPASVFGLNADDAKSPEDYCALVLRQICRAAVAGHPLGGGLVINYSDLPQAAWTRVLPHFGIACGDEDRARMAQTAQFNAKAPSMTFAGDSPHKKAAMTPELMAIANGRLGSVYAELNRLSEAPGR